MHFHVVSLFPRALDSYIKESIVKRAIEDKKIKVTFYNPRQYADNVRARIDRKPYGGGPGMVIQAEPVIRAIDAALKKIPSTRRKKAVVVFLTPRGKQFDTATAKTYASHTNDVIIVCGRYEGIDARIRRVFKMVEISIGPYVITGGELGAMVLIDSIARQVEGVLGDSDSLEENRVASDEVYTRPEVFTYKKKKYGVPEVLLSGHHADIEEWRKSH